MQKKLFILLEETQEALFDHLLKWKSTNKNHDPLQVFKECFEFLKMDNKYFIKHVVPSTVLSNDELVPMLVSISNSLIQIKK